MSRPNYVQVIARSWRQLVLTTLVGFILAVGFSFIQPFEYSSDVKLLITQTNPTGLDPYTAIKSTELIAQNLSEIIYTTAFFNGVISNSSVDANSFPSEEAARRKAWRRTIETAIAPRTGVMTITAYHHDRDQATVLASLTSERLAEQAPELFGFSVRAQVIDTPLASTFFTRPDFVKNALFGATAGILLGLAWVLWKLKE